MSDHITSPCKSFYWLPTSSSLCTGLQDPPWSAPPCDLWHCFLSCSASLTQLQIPGISQTWLYIDPSQGLCTWCSPSAWTVLSPRYLHASFLQLLQVFTQRVASQWGLPLPPSSTWDPLPNTIGVHPVPLHCFVLFHRIYYQHTVHFIV